MWGMPPFVARLLSKVAAEPLPSDINGSLALKPVIIPVLPDKLPTIVVSLEQFTFYTELVIDNLEGGYYHPDMKKNFNARSQKLLGDSGETMYGLDRKHGNQLSKYPEWGQFWATLDSDKKFNPNAYKYNRKDVPQAAALKKLASAIMYKWFSFLSGKYILISSMDEIANDERLIIHFSYASWNGEGWFKIYAEALNNAVQKYPGNKEMIFAESFKSRSQSSNDVIRQQATNMVNNIFKPKRML